MKSKLKFCKKVLDVAVFVLMIATMFCLSCAKVDADIVIVDYRWQTGSTVITEASGVLDTIANTLVLTSWDEPVFDGPGWHLQSTELPYTLEATNSDGTPWDVPDTFVESAFVAALNGPRAFLATDPAFDLDWVEGVTDSGLNDTFFGIGGGTFNGSFTNTNHQTFQNTPSAPGSFGSVFYPSVTYTPVAVPEPNSCFVLCLGIVFLGLLRNRRHQNDSEG